MLTSMGHTRNVMDFDAWTTIHKEPYVHEDGYVVETTRYVSPEVTLMSGGAHFTLNPDTPIPFPSGDHMILRGEFDLVDKDNNSVSLTEMYNHHWLLGAADGYDVLAPCEGDLFFGAGAEMRGMPTEYPKGYGVRRINATGRCGGNLHFIRTDHLKTKWNGMNDPSQFPEDMQNAAAIKNCIECGYAPNRALGVCTEAMDGFFSCCFTDSRCPAIGEPFERSKKSYHLTYEIKWTKDIFALDLIQGGVVDVGDSATSEWNVAPNLNDPRFTKNQRCNDTVCNITRTIPVVDQGYDGGATNICAGKMLDSYMHQHNGALYGKMFVNGKEVCMSTPKIGTGQEVGNEQGYVVGFEKCLDGLVPDEPVVLKKGDEVTLECLYDVDVNSTRGYPMPGGKHGGIMCLYFYGMVCDEGSYETTYTCRSGKCTNAGSMKGEFKTMGDCETSCGSDLTV